MASMLDRMRAAQTARQKSYETDGAVFTHWKIPVNASCTIRFIPFEDSRSQGFWVERKMIPVSFLDPEDDSKLIRYQIPCLEMYEPQGTVWCPALQPVRDLYSEAKELKNSGNTVDAKRINSIASAHWLKFTAYYQGFVNKPGYEEESTPENPIRIFPMSKQIHKVIYFSLFENEADPFDSLPTGEYTMDDVKLAMNMPDDYPEADFEALLAKFMGRDFIIQHTRSSDGDREFDKWDGSNTTWSRNEAPLTEEQLTALDQYGMHDLTKRLPERPSEAQYEVMVDMVQTSIGRLQGTCDGYWNKEWEEVDIKPWKKRGSADGGDGDKKSASKPAGGSRSLKDRLNKNKGDSDGGTDDGSRTEAPASTSKSLKDKLGKMNRGAKKVEEAAEAPAETPAEEPTTKSGAKSKKFSDLNAKIRAKIDAANAAE